MLTCNVKIFKGGVDDWKSLLRAAADYLPAISHESISRESERSRDGHPKGSNRIEKSSDNRESVQVNFLLGSFIAIDIISCASTGTTPSLDVDHVAVLQSLDVDTTYFMGCDSSILILIFEISQLDNWKKDANHYQKLSIIELAKRGSRIEEHIRHKIAQLDRISRTQLYSGRGKLLSAIHADIKKIFLLATVVYLHVVISGAQPELPEVKQGVFRTLVALQSLEDKELLAHAVWAFCIVGSMAVEDQREAFRRLFSAATANHSHSRVGTLREAFKVVETCWEMRENGSPSCDWVVAMLGHHVLLQ